MNSPFSIPVPNQCDGVRSPAESLRSLANRLRLCVRQADQRLRQRRALARLDARLLRDIGVTAEQAERESSKPFWRA